MSRHFMKLDLTFVDPIVNTTVHAYPGMGTSDDRKAGIKTWVTNSIVNWPGQDMYGIVDDGELLASLCLFTFDLNCRGPTYSLSYYPRPDSFSITPYDNLGIRK